MQLSFMYNKIDWTIVHIMYVYALSKIYACMYIRTCSYVYKCITYFSIHLANQLYKFHVP